MNIGPPSVAFPLPSLFILLALFVSMYSLWTIGQGSAFYSYIHALAIGALVWLFVYVIFGNFFASKGGKGQLLFLGLGFFLVVGWDWINSTFLHVPISLLPLSTLGPFSASLQVYNYDITWAIPVAFAVALYYARHDIPRILKGDFGIHV